MKEKRKLSMTHWDVNPGTQHENYLDREHAAFELSGGKAFTDFYKRFFKVSRPSYRMVSWMK